MSKRHQSLRFIVVVIAFAVTLGIVAAANGSFAPFLVVGETASQAGKISSPAGALEILAPLADGDLDTSFDTDGFNTTFFGADSAERTDIATGIAMQKNGVNAGKIIVGGDTLKSGMGALQDLAIARFNTNGSLDSGSGADPVPGDEFGTDGKVTVDFGGFDTNSGFEGSNFIAVDPTNDLVEGDKIVIVGRTPETPAGGGAAPRTMG